MTDISGRKVTVQKQTTALIAGVTAILSRHLTNRADSEIISGGEKKSGNYFHTVLYSRIPPPPPDRLAL
ncbi:MAG: hypothetical protein LBP19_05825 [Treponema sp.]|jgi:hypothetical protein|nr:hypothetical protein [Treponema sp.]